MLTKREWEVYKMRQDMYQGMQELFQWLGYLKVVPHGKAYWKRVQTHKGEAYEYLYLQHAVRGEHPYQKRVPEQNREEFLAKVDKGNYAVSRVKLLRSQCRQLLVVLSRRMSASTLFPSLDQKLRYLTTPQSIRATEDALSLFDSTYREAPFYEEVSSLEWEEAAREVAGLLDLVYPEAIHLLVKETAALYVSDVDRSQGFCDGTSAANRSAQPSYGDGVRLMRPVKE